MDPIKFHFITFGAGPYVDAVKRITEEAKKIKRPDGRSFFNSYIPLTDKDLPEDFWKRYPEHDPQNSIYNRKGFGYWIWKSFIILEEIKKIPEDEILVYFDSGFELYDTKAWRPYYSEIHYNDVVIQNVEFACYNPYEATGSLPTYTNRDYTKGDLFEHYGISPLSDFGEKAQVQSGFMMLRKNDETIKMLEEWHQLSSNYHLISDTPSISPNYITYIDHRHDQSTLNFALFVSKKHKLRIRVFPNYSEPWAPYQAFNAARNSGLNRLPRS